MTLDVETIVSIAGVVAGAVAGHVNGKRVGVAGSITTARDTVEMLALQVNLLNEENEKKDKAIQTLSHRVDTLQELVTQRAAVEEVKEVVDRIAEKVGV